MLRQKKKNEKEDRKVIAYFKRINRKTEKTDNEDEVKQTYRQKKKKRRRKRRRRREGKELVLHIHRNIYTSFFTAGNYLVNDSLQDTNEYIHNKKTFLAYLTDF